MKQTHHNSVPLKLLLLLIVSFDSPSRASAAGGSNFTDRLALLEFKKSITNDPEGVFKSWNDSLHFCNWVGINCSQEQRVTSLSLPGYSFQGTLSPHIGNLSFLETIQLTNNSFRGEIPQQFGNLLRLRVLSIMLNSLEGEIPVNLTRCSQLRELRLDGNGLTGTIPEGIGLLSNLEVIRIATNELTGPIPASLGNLSKLYNFGAAYNYLTGPIPETVGRLSRLTQFVVGVNQLNGTVPRSLYNLSSMIMLTLVHNQFQGRIPDDIGFTLPNLESYAVSLNWMSGPIPSSFCNASQIYSLNMNKNSFSGKIPVCFGSLPKLAQFHMGVNNLGTNSSGDFEFITGLTNCSQLRQLGVTLNNLGGPLPDSVGNLSVQLEQLYLALNSITGKIPKGLENLVNLNTVHLSYNFFTGHIPSYFGKFQKLQGIEMEGNQFFGQIPSSLGNLTQLNRLDISNNRLEGFIPHSLGLCRQLNELDVSTNRLTGEIPINLFKLSSLSVGLNLSWNSFTGRAPEEIRSLANVEALDLSHNFLTGGIPETIGDCKSLKTLYVQHNSFSGSIPLGLASLEVMESLDLSLNKFIGGIPSGLQDIQTLKYLNLSFNDLRGEVPTKGIFANASGISLTGNSMLCSTTVSELRLPDCPRIATSSKHKIASIVKLSVIIVLASLLFLFISGLLLHLKIKRSKKQTSVGDSTLNHFVMVSYKDLHQGTNGFSSDNLIGSGGFGTIYKGALEQIETPIAVKVLNNIQDEKSQKRLLAECNALRNVRHRNLVRILTYCSSLDYKGNEFKALVFEFMPNGSLDDWLHSDRNLSLIQRLNIAVDVTSGLHYLHDLCETPVVHCDLKPSNILLDVDLVAHVGDFGLARILSSDTSSSSSRIKSSSIGMKGTIGYAPPEYGMGKAVWKQGDAYSFGILLLEMFTGRRPTDEMFKDGASLCGFVKAAIPDRILSVLDPLLPLPVATGVGQGVGGSWAIEDVDGNGVEVVEMTLMASATNCLVLVLEIALSCAAELPRDRMKMADVVRKLTSIRDDFVASFHVRQGMPDRG